MDHAKSRPARSILYVPADNDRALAKIVALDCDAVVIDLEDAVAPEAKAAARQNMMRFLAAWRGDGPTMVVRVNPLSGEWGGADLEAAAVAGAAAILLCKVDGPRDIQHADDALDRLEADPRTALWAMVETPKALFNLGAIAALGLNPGTRLTALVAGTNDLAKETGVLATPDRRYLQAWLLQIVAAARAAGLSAFDGVMNDFGDPERLESECMEGRNMGFDGKTLIHPAQIQAANRIFSPTAGEIAEADAIVAAFGRPENAGKGVIRIGGRMVERLHLAQAERILARARR